MNTTTNKETATMKYAIKLTSGGTNAHLLTPPSRKVKFLHSHRTGLRARITTTTVIANARKFATEADAQEFINTHAGYFGYKWEVQSTCVQ